MKKILIFTSLIIFSTFSLPSFCQKVGEKIPDEYNFYKLLEHNKEWFAGKEADTSADNENVKNYRFIKFWTDRVSKDGDMREYPLKMEEYFATKLKALKKTGNTYNPDCEDCCFPSNWSYFGPHFLETQNLGKINTFWVDPGDEDYILAGSECGLFKTIDGGANWDCITDFDMPGIGIFSIDVQPDNTDIIYVSTGYSNAGGHNGRHYGYGVYKTIDGGLTWDKMNIQYGTPEEGFSNKVLINPLLYNNVYAIVESQVFKTTNSGASWSNIFDNISNNIYKLPLVDLEIRVNGSFDEVYVSSSTKIKDWDCKGPLSSETFFWGNPAGGYCVTNYTAKVWQFNSDHNKLNSYGSVDLSLTLPGYNPVTTSVALSFTSNSKTIACQSNYDESPGKPPIKINIYRQLNTPGSPWINIAATIVPYDFPFEVSSADDNIMYIGADGVLYKSIDNGATFNPLWGYWDFISQPAKQGCHADIRALQIYQSSSSPGNNDKLFWGDDGGLGKSNDGGITSVNLNGKGLQLTQFHGISNSEILPNLIYGGAQDNGILDNKIQSWRVYPRGDGYECVVDNANPPKAYSTVNGSILTTTVGGITGWFSPWSCPENHGCWDCPLHIDDNNNFYLCGKDVFKRDDINNSWINITNLSSDTEITHINDIVLNSGGNIGYICYSGSVAAGIRKKKIYRISNLLTTPIVTDITVGLTGVDWRGATNLATNEAGSIVWACFGGLGEPYKKVCKYENNVWTEYGGNGLPGIPANSIEYLNNSNELVFLGMDDGVYYRDKSMSDWKEFRCSLPHVIVSDLKINYETNELRAATYGRGIWKTSIKAKNYATCSGSTSAIATITNQYNSDVTLSNGTFVPVWSYYSPVTIKLTNYCNGTNNCNTSQVNWKLFMNDILIGTGTGDVISFSGWFRHGFWSGWGNLYKVEVNILCGNVACPTLTYYLDGRH